MKLKAYIKALQEIEKANPNLLVIYARDEEGNGYEKVTFHPTPGVFMAGEFEGEGVPTKMCNAICIN